MKVQAVDVESILRARKNRVSRCCGDGGREILDQRFIIH